MKFKSLIFAFFLFLLFDPLSSVAWEKVASCDGDRFVIDRQISESGDFEYQAVFRDTVVESMMQQNVATFSQLNEKHEIIRKATVSSSERIQACGMLNETLGFMFANTFEKSDHFSILFHERGSVRGNYVFHNCWFRYRKL